MIGFFPSAPAGSRTATMGVQVTCGAANTKGSWAQVTAALTYPCDGFILKILPNDSETYLFDVGIGAGGSEVVILPNLQFSGPTTQFTNYITTFVPLHIPLGERIAFRAQATAASAIAYCYMCPVAGPFWSSFSAQKADAYGVNTGDSGGTTITPSTSANVKGSYAQLSAAIEGFTSCIVAQNVDDPDNAFDNANFALDLAVGAGGSEVILAPDLQGRSSTANDNIVPQWLWLPISAARGERLAARGASSVTTADRIFDCSVIGFR